MQKIPASKSILQRLMVILAHSRAELCIENYNACDDVLELEKALQVFGYEVFGAGSRRHFVFDPIKHQQSTHQYYFKASATAYRLWLSVMANLPGIFSEVQASQTLFKRGIMPLVEALKELGAECEVQGRKIRIKGAKLRAKEIGIEASRSSQYASSLVLAAPFMEGDLRLIYAGEMVSKPYLDLSVAMLQSFGASVEMKSGEIWVKAGALKMPEIFRVDTDLSTAAFYGVRAALGAKAQELEVIYNPGFMQADAAIWDILNQMGAKVESEGEKVRIHPAKLRGIELDLTPTPDLMPVLCVMALFCDSPSVFRGIGRLKYKESDRAKGIAQALELLAADFTLKEDEIKIYPYRKIPPFCVLDTKQDHRLVMAFSLLAERFSQVKLSEWESVTKSLPDIYSPPRTPKAPKTT